MCVFVSFSFSYDEQCIAPYALKFVCTFWCEFKWALWVWLHKILSKCACPHLNACLVYLSLVLSKDSFMCFLCVCVAVVALLSTTLLSITHIQNRNFTLQWISQMCKYTKIENVQKRTAKCIFLHANSLNKWTYAPLDERTYDERARRKEECKR